MNLIFARLISELTFALVSMTRKAQPAPIPCLIDRPLQPPDRTFW